MVVGGAPVPTFPTLAPHYGHSPHYVVSAYRFFGRQYQIPPTFSLSM